MKLNKKIAFIGALLTAVLVGCGGFVYTTVGGTVKGLTSDGNSILVLKNEAGYSTRVTADGAFSFRVASNGSYAITVAGQPNPVNCTVLNGTGTMHGDAAVTSVAVNCVPNVPLAGTLTNMGDGKFLNLSVNDVPQTSLSANGAFKFQTYVVDGQPYTVKVITPPAAQVCNVINGFGKANINDLASASNISVNCVAGVPVSLTVAGLKLSNPALVLTNNGENSLVISVDGTYTFSFSLLDGQAYNIEIATQPAGQKCTVTNGKGVVSLADPTKSTTASVACVAA